MDVGLVCDQCSAFNAMGVSLCVRCGEPVSLDSADFSGPTSIGPGPLRPPAPSERAPVVLATSRNRPLLPDLGTVADPNPCPTCGEHVIPGHRFCGACGGRMGDTGAPRVSGALEGAPSPALAAASAAAAASSHQSGSVPSQSPAGVDKSGQRRTQYFGVIQAAKAKLTVIRGDGLDGVSFSLAGQDHFAGRVDCPLLFPDDPFLSPVHCNFFYKAGQLIVRDEGSANGLYVRISGSRPVPFGSRILVGEQLLEVERGDVVDEAIEDGTYFFASPRRPSHLRVVQRLRGGDSGLAHRATSDAVTVGREGNDVNFPDDPFISGHHARMTWDGQNLILTDLGSKNGTFLRVIGEQQLGHGDYVFMGQQLLRVEVV